MTGTLTVTRAGRNETLEWDTDVPESAEVARQRFNEVVGGGGFAFAELATGEREQVREFDPQTQPRVVVAYQIAGGC